MKAKSKQPTFNAQRSTSKVSYRQVAITSETEWMLHDGETSNRVYDLEDRLLEFASTIIDLSEKLPASRAGNHVAGQILRSGTSPYPNHGEAEAAESREDFIHKLRICLKELRETRRWSRLIDRKKWVPGDPALKRVLVECDELIRIFYASIQTARRNALQPKNRDARKAGSQP